MAHIGVPMTPDSTPEPTNDPPSRDGLQKLSPPLLRSDPAAAPSAQRRELDRSRMKALATLVVGLLFGVGAVLMIASGDSWPGVGFILVGATGVFLSFVYFSFCLLQ